MKRTSLRPMQLAFKAFWLVPLLAAQIASAALQHEWSFNDPTASTNATDSIGGATGALYGGATYPGNGTVALDGTNGFVYLPNDIVSNYTSVSFEMWATPNTEPTWARLFDFGENSGGPGTGGGDGHGYAGTSFINFILPDNNGLLDASMTTGGGLAGGPVPAVGVYHHLVFTVDAVAQTAALYDNGKRLAYAAHYTGTPQAVGHTYNDYIGRSQFSGDPLFNGSFDEFRIYDNALTPAQVEADFEAGAGATNASPGSLTAIQFNNSTNTVAGGVIVPVVLGTYSALTNQVDITTLSGISYSSDNTNVISFGSDGRFHAVTVGTTTIRAAYLSQNAALSVTVSLLPAVLLHRYSFNGAAGTTAITDSVGGANGTLVNGTATAELNGSGQLVLDGNASSAWVSLPSGIMPQLTNATFEIWVNDQNLQTWAELWTFGTNNGSAGQNYLSMIPVDGGLSRQIGLDNHNGAVAGGHIPLNQAICLTAVYNYSAQTASIYVNGRKTGSGTVSAPINTIPDPDNYIGQSQYYGGGDPYFTGILDEFRIYSGVESDLQLAIDAAAGPDNILTNPGALLSVTVTAANTNVDVHGAGVPVEVLANFVNVSNVDVTTLSGTTVTSGNTSIGIIKNGNFIPLNAGASVVTATYSSLSGSVAFNAVDTNAWPTLLHRWSFNEPPGSTTLTDSVANVNGTINGPAVFDGQKMSTPSIVNQEFSNSGTNGQPAASAAWVAFPAGQGVVTGLPNEASFEIWVVWNGSQEWAELFDFGQAATPGVSTGGGQYVMIAGQDNNGVLHAEWDQNPAYDVTIEGPTALPIGQLCQIIYSHDQDRQVDKLYLNGQLVNSAVNTALWSSLPDTDNWMARDEWPDPVFSGQYWDFRIWNGALTSGQVANLYAAGPQAVAGPPVQISPAGNSHVTISWPANVNAPTFTLQSRTNLVAGTWTSVSGTPTMVNGQNTLTIPASQSATFYRLNP